MRRSLLYLAITLLQVAAIVSLGVGGRHRLRAEEAELLPLKREVVRRLQLTDVALWTEARYTRHPTQADFFSPFQDFPSSPEHFPAGSVISPPPRIPGAAPDELERETGRP